MGPRKSGEAVLGALAVNAVGACARRAARLDVP